MPGLIRGVLELAVCEGDVNFIKYLVTKQGVDVNGEPVLIFMLFPPTHESTGRAFKISNKLI